MLTENAYWLFISTAYCKFLMAFKRFLGQPATSVTLQSCCVSENAGQVFDRLGLTCGLGFCCGTIMLGFITRCCSLLTWILLLTSRWRCAQMWTLPGGILLIGGIHTAQAASELSTEKGESGNTSINVSGPLSSPPESLDLRLFCNVVWCIGLNSFGVCHDRPPMMEILQPH